MRLIDADALKESVHVHDYVLKDCLNSTDKGMFTVGIMQAIDEQPTVDAVPVRHGKWKNDCVGVLRCSECNAQAPWKYGMDYIDYRWKANYCPNCGARMDAK